MQSGDFMFKAHRAMELVLLFQDSAFSEAANWAVAVHFTLAQGLDLRC